MIDIFIAVLKYASMLLTGIFGIMGLLVKYKDDQGNITRAGRTALALILVSTILAVSLHSLELIRQRNERRSASEKRARETLETVRRTEETLFQISRTVYPIKDVQISYWVDIPMEHIGVKGYVERFERELTAALVDFAPRELGVRALARDARGAYIDTEFARQSPLMPRREREYLAAMVLGWSALKLEFYKPPITPQAHPNISSDLNNRPDLSIFLAGGINSRDSAGYGVAYNLPSKRFTLRTLWQESEPAGWEGNGTIVGVPDLLGAQMFVSLPSFMLSSNTDLDRQITEIRKEAELAYLAIAISGRRMILKVDDMERYTDRDGFPMYVFTIAYSPRRQHCLYIGIGRRRTGLRWLSG